jgi:hypothetical protein
MPDSNVMKTNHPLADDDDGDTNEKTAIGHPLLLAEDRTVACLITCIVII